MTWASLRIGLHEIIMESLGIAEDSKPSLQFAFKTKGK